LCSQSAFQEHEEKISKFLMRGWVENRRCRHTVIID